MTLLDTRLYLPKDWVEDCRTLSPRTHVRKRPANCEANASLRWSWSIRPANTASDLAYVAVDGGYGKDPAFLRGLETRSLCFLADVHKHQRIWLDDPAP